MSDKGYEIHPSTLYTYQAGSACGVLITERIMKKLVKLQHEHLEKVQRLLSDNKEECFPYGWTLYYPEGKQTEVVYIDKSSWQTIEQSIKWAVHAGQPIAKFPVFISEGHEEAKAMAEKRYESVPQAEPAKDVKEKEAA